MKMRKFASAEDYKLLTSFEAVRRTLCDERFADRLDRPLAWWALPGDRRLPLALLGRTIGELIAMPFEELSATPGIGQKKIGALVKLLHRATRDVPPPAFADPPHESASATAQGDGFAAFDPDAVSESHWAQWRDTARRHALERAPLGRFTPSLQQLPTVIWRTPLGEYLDLTLAEIRARKTHGEKRVRAVLEAFFFIQQLLGAAPECGHLALRLVARFAVPIEAYLAAQIAAQAAPTAEAIRECVTLPLVRQTHVDGGDTLLKLLEGRLGIRGPVQSVRTQASKMGVTRARIYQMLDQCSEIMEIRWPEGGRMLACFAQQIGEWEADDRALAELAVVRELFFPE